LTIEYIEIARNNQCSGEETGNGIVYGYGNRRRYFFSEGVLLDLFDKCSSFTLADEVKQKGVYPYFRPIQANEGPVVQMEGHQVIMAGSNNYLGLTAHPKVKEAAIQAVRKYGTGCSGSRYLTGTLDLHVELEGRLAKFLGTEDCLLFSTGFQTAQGIIPTLVQRGEYVVSDKDNHACIVAGNMIALGMTAEVVRYKHNDMKHLESMLSKLRPDSAKLIVSDGVFSTSGEIVDLPPLVKAAKKHNARILIDDAHATGVIGKGGRGTASHFGLEKDVDLTMGTFSKTFASLGGFVCGRHSVINYVKHHAPALIFSASPTPASVAAALAALDILEAEPERITRLQCNAAKMREGFRSMGFKIIDGHESAIVPVIIGETEKTLIFWRALYDAGVFVNAFVRPGVAPGMEMLRTSYMATHEDKHLDKILEIFGVIGKKLGVIN
jgi:8-amino-7-oxononanoate synthase